MRPGLLGPLCRVENWCEVEEVEEELHAREVRIILLLRLRRDSNHFFLLEIY
jgi:hypothetical protein